MLDDDDTDVKLERLLCDVVVVAAAAVVDVELVAFVVPPPVVDVDVTSDESEVDDVGARR